MTSEGEGEPVAMTFEVLKSAIIDGSAARLGRLALAGRKSVDTPNFFAVTSRGVVPHMTPDNVGKHLHAGGAYMALEDFIERPQQYLKRPPPIYETPITQRHPRALHSFTAMPSSVMTILGARRIPAVPSPMGNTKSSVSVFTSTGFQVLTTTEYHQAVEALQPDIVVPLADLSHGPVTPNSKRALRMAEQTDEWLKAWFADLDADAVLRPRAIATFAPVLPVNYSIQWEYLERLSEDLVPSNLLSGLAVYDPDVLPDLLKDYPNMCPLPRLSLSAPPTPHHILRHIALGLDAFVLPFINTVSDAGLALTFSFPAGAPPTSPGPLGTRTLPLAIDLSAPEHKFSLAPLSRSCTCYACTRHHAAYLHHLLAAREMLGWTLLQTHNHAVMAAFFAGVRAALVDGQDAFADAVRRFADVYEPEFPAGTGERPRARGYQYKSGGGDKKRNKPGWERYEGGVAGEGEQKAVAQEVGVEPGSKSEGLETPPVPGEVDGDANELDHMGFAKIVRIDERKKA